MKAQSSSSLSWSRMRLGCDRAAAQAARAQAIIDRHEQGRAVATPGEDGGQ
jgi:hypothetical protein